MRRLLTLGLLALCACKETPAAKPAPTVVDAGALAQAVEPGAVAHPAARCAECHGRMEQEWKPSAHAQSSTRATFVASRPEGAAGAACDRCHAPLAGRLDRAEPATREGVTCEVCHTLKSVRVEARSASYTLNLQDNVKYGPLCDSKDHYFHKMGCSPLQDEAELCASCHLLFQAGADGGEPLPIYTEYAEWKESDHGTSEMPCQDCHLDTYRGLAAEGFSMRPKLHTHDFLGGDGTLRQQALKLKLRVSSVEGKPGALSVEAELKNKGAGHSVPTGFPGRRVEFKVRAVNRDGQTLAEAARIYARVLENARGEEVPHPLAVRVRSDNRIKSDEARAESFTLEVPPDAAGTLLAEVTWIELSPELAKQLGRSELRRVVMVEAKVPFGPDRPSGGRAQLPRTLEVPK